MPSLTGPLDTFSPFDPWFQLMMHGASTNDPAVQHAIASLLAAQGKAPPPTPSGTTIAPPTGRGGIAPTAQTAAAGAPAGPAPAAPPPVAPHEQNPIDWLAGLNWGQGPLRGIFSGDATDTSAGQPGAAGTVPQITPQMRTPGDAGAGARTGSVSGEPDRTPPSTVGNTGSDGQSVQPGPIAPSLLPTLRPDTTTPSPKDSGTFLGEEAPGRRGKDPGVTTSADDTSKGQDPTDKSQKDVADTDKAMKALDLMKALSGLAPPASQDWRTPLPQRPGMESRFTPVDLMTMIRSLGQPGTAQQPQSLGALIGRG